MCMNMYLYMVINFAMVNFFWFVSMERESVLVHVHDKCKCLYAHICMYMYVCTCMYVHVCIHMHVFTCMYPYACIPMYLSLCIWQYKHYNISITSCLSQNIFLIHIKTYQWLVHLRKVLAFFQLQK